MFQLQKSAISNGPAFAPSEKRRAAAIAGLFRHIFKFLRHHLLPISNLSKSLVFYHAVAIQADCCQVSIRSKKVVDKINLSLETIDTTLENKGMLFKILILWLKSVTVNFGRVLFSMGRCFWANS